jgi:hypothetical protein
MRPKPHDARNPALDVSGAQSADRQLRHVGGLQDKLAAQLATWSALLDQQSRRETALLVECSADTEFNCRKEQT